MNDMIRKGKIKIEWDKKYLLMHRKKHKQEFIHRYGFRGLQMILNSSVRNERKKHNGSFKNVLSLCMCQWVCL